MVGHHRYLQFVIVIFSFSASLLFNIVSADPIVDSVLSRVYDGYDQQNACWRAQHYEGDGFCCLKIKRQDRLNTAKSARLYLLLTGQCYNNKGELDDSHASSGIVGAFVLGLGENNISIIAGHPRMPMGSWGTPPEDWSLIKLGPNDYWGWKAEGGYSGQGVSWSWYSFLVPYGKSIRELTAPLSFDDSGNCSEENECRLTTIDGKLEIDSTQIDVAVFPLHLTLKGKVKGKKLAPKTWVLPFDTKSWSYKKPKGLPDMEG